MSDTRKPVWVWLPGEQQPVQCGVLTLTNKVGSFEYLPEYKSRSNALALDPIHLPLTRSGQPFKETRQGGLFGVK